MTAFASGGTGPYTFEWSNGLSGVGFNVNGNLTAGDYTVDLTVTYPAWAVTRSAQLDFTVTDAPVP